MLAIGIGGNTLTGYNITDSLRFRSGGFFQRTYTTSPTDAKKLTVSLWMKRGKLSTDQIFLSGYNGSSADRSTLWFTSANQIKVNFGGGSATPVTTTPVFRDTSAWYHIVITIDTTDATASNRVKIYVNGEQITSFASASYPAQNATHQFLYQNSLNWIGTLTGTSYYYDGYLTEFYAIDGQALTPSDFGETNADGVWSPKEYTGTYGTNGFYLPMKETTQATGFNTVLYEGNGGTQDITGVGFSPDLVWLKARNTTTNHILSNTVTGTYKYLSSNTTNAEATDANGDGISAFNSDGFSVAYTDGGAWNNSSNNYVAWCWDAGSSTVSNTDGDITTSVRANPATGFSVATFTGNGLTAQTIGHGLSQPTELYIWKRRNSTEDWGVETTAIDGTADFLKLNTTDAKLDSGTAGQYLPTSTTQYISFAGAGLNSNGGTYVCYSFHSVAGYSKIGSYTGTGATGNSITTGFRPAFVMFKRTDSASNWLMIDSTRTTYLDKHIHPNLSNAEATASAPWATFSDTGFTLTSAFGETNASGGTYIYMAFADTRDYQWNFDASGNKNNWTPNNINSNASSETTYDLMSDVPSLADEDTGNFATLNPLVIGDGGTMSDGNLTFTTPTATRGFHAGTIGMTSGKWYWEVTCSASTFNSTNRAAIGYKLGNERSSYVISGTDGDVGNIGFYIGDTVGFAFDADNGTLENFINGVSNATVSSIDMTKTWFPIGADAHTAQNGTVHWNFGQRPFKYTPPTGYKKLNTYNLPDSSITDGSKYMNTVLYTGNGSTQSITGVGFQPDFTWIKSRSAVYQHQTYDVVRGATKKLLPSTTDAESTDSTALQSFDADGFTVGTNVGVNQNNATHAAWNWKANGSGVSNTDGTITSTVSANTTSGFSVVTYTGNGTNNASVGHGLGNSADVVIVKQRDGTYRWITWHSVLGNDHRLHLDGTEASSSSSLFVRSSNATTFTLGTAGNVNGNGSSFVAYCFAEVEGFSKFGSYTGNGSTDGPFVHTGFRPAFVLFKNTSSTNGWFLLDSTRNTYNVANTFLRPNASDAEANAANSIADFTSNGFKLRGVGGDVNTSGSTYIYMAFAENPFKNSLAR